MPRPQIRVESDSPFKLFLQAGYMGEGDEIREKYILNPDYTSLCMVQHEFNDAIPDLVLGVSKAQIIELGKGVDPNYKYPSKQLLAEKTAIQKRARELGYIASMNSRALFEHVSERYNQLHPDAPQYNMVRKFQALLGLETGEGSVGKAEKYYNAMREGTEEQRAELVAQKLMELAELPFDRVDLTDDKSILDNFDICSRIAFTGTELKSLKDYVEQYVDLSQPRFAKFRENAALLEDMSAYLNIRINTMASTAYPFYDFPEMTSFKEFHNDKYEAQDVGEYMNEVGIDDYSFRTILDSQVIAQSLTANERANVLLDKTLTPIQRIDAYKARKIDPMNLNAGKYDAEKAALSAKLEENIAIYKASVPAFEISDLEKQVMLSDENIEIYKRAKALTDRREKTAERYGVQGIPQGFHRIASCMMNKADTPEADRYNRDLLYAMSGKSAKSNEFLKQAWVDSINRVLELDLNKLTAPGREGLEYALAHHDELVIAWTAKDMLEHVSTGDVGFDAKNEKAQAQINELVGYCQTVGSYGAQIIKFAAQGDLITFPFAKFRQEQIPQLLENHENKEFLSIVGSTISMKVDGGFEDALRILAENGTKPKPATLSLFRDIDRPKYAEQKAAEDKKLREYETIRKTAKKQLEKNIKALKEDFPGFDVTKEQFDSYLSDRRIDMHLRAKAIMDRINLINDLTGAKNHELGDQNDSPFNRMLPFIADDNEMGYIIDHYKAQTPEGAALRYDLWQRAMDRLYSLDLSRMAKDVPEDEKMEYAINHPDAMFAAFVFNDYALAGLKDTGYSLSPAQAEKIEKLRADMQAVGGLGQVFIEYMASDSFLTLPREQMQETQFDYYFYEGDEEQTAMIKKGNQLKDGYISAYLAPPEITQEDLNPGLYIAEINAQKEASIRDLPEEEAAAEVYARSQEALFDEGVRKTNKMHDDLQDPDKFKMGSLRRWATSQLVKARDELTDMVGRDADALDMQKVTNMMATVYVCEYARANPAFKGFKDTKENCEYFAKITKNLAESDRFRKGIEETLRSNPENENEVGKDLINRFLAGRVKDMKEIGKKLGLADVLNQAVEKTAKPAAKAAAKQNEAKPEEQKPEEAKPQEAAVK